MLGLTFSVHASSVLDLFVAQFHRLRDRVVLAIAVMLGLYAWSLHAGRAIAQGGSRSGGISLRTWDQFSPADTVLVNCLGTPRFGSVVVYGLGSQVDLGGNASGYQVILPAGERVGLISGLGRASR